MFRLKKLFFTACLILVILFSAGNTGFLPAEDALKWQRFSGNWKVENSYLVEKQAWASPWHYYELLNLNSLISYEKFDSYNSMELIFSVNKPGIKIKTTDRVPDFMVSFNVTSPYKNWNYHIYGIKFTGDEDVINQVSLIYSDRIDVTKKYATKNNTFVKVLASKKIKLDYGKEYSVKINLVGNNAITSIDGKEVINGQMPESEHGGKIAFSSKNLLLKVREITVFNNKDVVFKDDFSQDTIYNPRMRARKEKKK